MWWKIITNRIISVLSVQLFFWSAPQLLQKDTEIQTSDINLFGTICHSEYYFLPSNCHKINRLNLVLLRTHKYQRFLILLLFYYLFWFSNFLDKGRSFSKIGRGLCSKPIWGCFSWAINRIYLKAKKKVFFLWYRPFKEKVKFWNGLKTYKVKFNFSEENQISFSNFKNMIKNLLNMRKKADFQTTRQHIMVYQLIFLKLFKRWKLRER